MKDKSEKESTATFDIDKEFFVINSEHLEDISPAFYGYGLLDGEVITAESDIDKDTLLSGCEGAYVNISRCGGKIVISQDYLGSYGLYLFSDNGYFALSNSFLYLAEYLAKEGHKITLNKEYASQTLSGGLCSQSYAETMINEIVVLDRSAQVFIDIEKKKIEIRLSDFKENTVDIDSPEGMAILDDWYERWTGIIRNLYEKTSNIQTDLSGGMDSRLTLELFIGSGINLDGVNVNSLNDRLHTHAEDYEIASAIAKSFGFELNRDISFSGSVIPYSLEDIVNISFYTKLGMHTQMYWKRGRRANYLYLFTGGGAEKPSGIHQNTPIHRRRQKIIYIREHRRQQNMERISQFRQKIFSGGLFMA